VRLASSPLRFSAPSPPSGYADDFHPKQAVMPGALLKRGDYADSYPHIFFSVLTSRFFHMLFYLAFSLDDKKGVLRNWRLPGASVPEHSSKNPGGRP